MNKKNEIDRRPWGNFEVISDEPDHKVKRIVVYPNQRISLQKHKQRSEHWFILKGKAIVTLDGKEIVLEKGHSIDIAKGTAHRIKSIGSENLVFIEVQTGDYFGEDDIERIEDDFGRT